MHESKEPPGNKNAFPPPKKMLERNRIDDRTFSHIAIVDETEGNDQQAS